VYTSGIITLSILAAILLIVFGGVTDRLIPMFAVGAFLAFTMSQLGMVGHWRRSGQPWHRHSLVLNGAGAAATAVALVIITVSKFGSGAWLTALVIPGVTLLFVRMRRYHDRIRALTKAEGEVDVSGLTPSLVVMPLRRLDQVGRKALRFALTISSDVRVVQVCAEDLDIDDLEHRWPDLVQKPLERLGYPRVPLYVVRSPYRQFLPQLLAWLACLVREHPDRHVIVLIPELVHRRWYQFIVHHRATRLKTRLLLQGGPNVSVMSSPWYPDPRAH
jgi:hypothetical protein